MSSYPVTWGPAKGSFPVQLSLTFTSPKYGGNLPYTLGFIPGDTLGKVRKRIAESHFLPLKLVLFTFTGPGLENFDDETYMEVVWSKCFNRPGNTQITFLPEPPQMLIFRTVKGAAISLMVSPKATIADVKQMIAEQRGISPGTIRLIAQGSEMDDSCIVKHLGLSSLATCHILFD